MASMVGAESPHLLLLVFTSTQTVSRDLRLSPWTWNSLGSPHCCRGIPPIAFLLRAIRTSVRKPRIVENTIDVCEGRDAEMQRGTTQQTQTDAPSTEMLSEHLRE
jgi:hypothetical protein